MQRSQTVMQLVALRGYQELTMDSKDFDVTIVYLAWLCRALLYHVQVEKGVLLYDMQVANEFMTSM